MVKVLLISIQDVDEVDITGFVKDLEKLTAKKKYDGWTIMVSNKKFDTYKLDIDTMESLKQNGTKLNSES